jgi:hypothetical protein
MGNPLGNMQPGFACSARLEGADVAKRTAQVNAVALSFVQFFHAVIK